MLLASCLVYLLAVVGLSQAFLSPSPPHRASSTFLRSAAADSATSADPIAFATGHSTNTDLMTALQEAVTMAAKTLPPHTSQVDLALVSVSSLYDGGTQQPATVVVPAVLAAGQVNDIEIQHLIGSSVAGCISSSSSTTATTTTDLQQQQQQPLEPVEYEAIPAVSVTLAVLPETSIKTFHLDELPDDVGRLPAEEFKTACGMNPAMESSVENPMNFLLLPSPAFSTNVEDLLFGLDLYFPHSQVVGGVASTVSSLSRAKLYQWSATKGSDTYSACFTEGCVGVALQGDIQIESMTAQGAKPVGGIYQIVKGQDSTISVIVLDETATEALEEDVNEDEDEEDEDESVEVDAKTRAAQAYAKARIPKPVLAEANFLMKTLSDDDQAFMRRQLLVGLEQQSQQQMTARTASELARLAAGEGHRFTIQQVASAGMKDGSVTLPLGSVQVVPGTRLRFFVREADFAKREVEALWVGYKKRRLNQQFAAVADDDEDESSKSNFVPAACWMIPTLDRGSKFFAGKAGYESSAAARMMPAVPCISGFFSNGVVLTKQTVQGSASGYFLLGSASGRPVYSPQAKEAEAESTVEEEPVEAEEKELPTSKGTPDLKAAAPRSEDGELILKRREVHSGRALTVSTVEWSVAEKTAIPTSALEGYMWDKETEVDRFRERVPLANLVSQCRLSADDPKSPKPRDFVSSIKQAAQEGNFVVVPEIKQTDPDTGSLHRRFDVEKQARAFTLAGVPAMMVNCDPILFGGSLDDIKKAREASSKAAVEQMSEDGVVVPPVLALDLILYPYQLYKLRLAGADAVNLITGALSSKDLIYLTKIASSLQLQVLVTVTSEVQIKAVSALPAGSFDGVIVSNRELEDFSFDGTGNQAMSLLKSEALVELKEKHGDIPVLAQGRVGMIERSAENNPKEYLAELQKAGSAGAVIGGGLAGSDPIATLQSLQK